MSEENRLRLALPKGSLQETTLKLFANPTNWLHH